MYVSTFNYKKSFQYHYKVLESSGDWPFSNFAKKYKHKIDCIDFAELKMSQFQDAFKLQPLPDIPSWSK